MLLNLLRFGFVAVLLLGNWGGALAAAACPHAGAIAGSHACCRRSAKHDSPHCHDHSAQTNEMSHGEQHDTGPQASRAAVHHPDANQSDAVRSAPLAAQSDNTCLHCLTRPAPTSASVETLETGRARHEAGRPAQSAQRQTTLYDFSLTRAIVPLEHAPPSPRARRHVLLGIFLI